MVDKFMAQIPYSTKADNYQMYWTSHLPPWSSDGTVGKQDRLDHQVKIRKLPN